MIKLEIIKGRISIFSIRMSMSPGKAINMMMSGSIGVARRRRPPHTAPRITPGRRTKKWSRWVLEGTAWCEILHIYLKKTWFIGLMSYSYFWCSASFSLCQCSQITNKLSSFMWIKWYNLNIPLRNVKAQIRGKIVISTFITRFLWTDILCLHPGCIFYWSQD